MINAPDQWDPALDVGDPLIDSQHRVLFQMIVDLDKRMVREDFGHGVLSALSGMKAYAHTHFEDEVAMMARAGWPGLTGHKAMHAKFMEKTALFGSDALSDSEWTALDMLRYLLDWLIQHIRVQDKAFFDWRARQNSQTS